MSKTDFHKKSEEIKDTILHKIKDFNRVYRSGPDVYFYKRVLSLNKQAEKLSDFINDDYNLEIIYATLVAWDMNSRGARMKYFDDFKENILYLTSQFQKLWKKNLGEVVDFEAILNVVSDVYDKLHIMKTNGKLVSNSKLLHFLFPHLLMPMDRSNTLMYFYRHTNESKEKYFDLIRWSYDMTKKRGIIWSRHLDDHWNSTIPKILDNAIIIKNNKFIGGV
ncbi:MAG: hypothetical protein WCI77_06940 [Candidatus Omnitrophota bacterium]